MGSSFALPSRKPARHGDRRRRHKPDDLAQGARPRVVASASADASVAEMADVIVIGRTVRPCERSSGSSRARRRQGRDRHGEHQSRRDGVGVVCGHRPLVATDVRKETSGIDAADSSVFKMRVVLTRSEPVLTDLVKAVGAHPVVMDARRTTGLVAGVSHTAFLLSVGYVLALSRRPDWPEASRLRPAAFVI